ncbi:hypothetical protein [Mycobacterium sp. CnD-18-1]|uniref:hypothetical protein n=1 Tax=Mycobacterium sp. CnD-18-1 TaxID=2917744 RepID=UPI001EF16FAC|nr:hypothetical protein [Mycobacterium sp. CnD-18-1]MCG7607138.1 hypothetical protein [Mycobacterium sp. CnD-18-1]
MSSQSFNDIQRNYLGGYLGALGVTDTVWHTANIESFLLLGEINPSDELVEQVRASLCE